MRDLSLIERLHASEFPDYSDLSPSEPEPDAADEPVDFAACCECGAPGWAICPHDIDYEYMAPWVREARNA